MPRSLNKAYFMKISSRMINNILIIKPGAIGDLLQLAPVTRALRKRYPDAAISLIVGSLATAELFKYNSDINQTILFDKGGMHKSFLSILKLWQRLRRERYDLIINFQRSNLKTWLLASASFPCQVLVYHKARKKNLHAVVNYLDTLAPLGINTQDLNLKLTPGADDRAFAHRIISSFEGKDRPLVALNPGASHQVNRWSVDQFAELADILANNISAGVIIIGGPDDVVLAKEIAAKTCSKPLIMAGIANLLQMSAILERSDVLVSGDTGPMHLATAVGTRVVALFGAADPGRTGPVGSGHRVIQAEGVDCVPCRNRTCKNKKYLECMERISVNTVFNAVQEMVMKR